MEQELENPKCTCPDESCPRHGKCTECQEYHHSHDSKTNCGK